MQRSTVTDYFKVKKRIHDDSLSTKSSKLLAVSTASENIGGPDTPNPIRVSAVTPSSSPEPVNILEQNSSELESSNINDTVEIDRITAKGKRRVPCFKRYHHLVSNSNQEDMAPALNKQSSTPISSQAIKATTSANGSSTVNKSPPLNEPYASCLPLPYKYHILAELFRALDTVSSILFNRKEVITFSKVKPAVLELVRTTRLREKHLAQFLTVLPGCYSLAQEKSKIPGTNDFAYQLILTPKLGGWGSAVTNKMSAALLEERRKAFEANLLERCYQRHKEFLLTLVPPIVIPPNQQITRWHPKFPINEVADIEVSEIPKAPERGSISASTAKDVIARAQNIIESANPRMKKALEELMRKTGENSGVVFPTSSTSPGTPAPVPHAVAAEKAAAAKSSIQKAQEALMAKARDNPKMRAALNKILAKNNKTAIPEPATPPDSVGPASAAPPQPLIAPKVQQKGNELNKKLNSALKGVSQTLLDKIRAREQEKAIRSMTLTPEETKRRAMLNRLPGFIKVVRNTMVAEKKAVLPLHVVVERLGHSAAAALTNGEVESHVRFLQRTAPDWLSLVKTTQGEFVKINKDVNINDVVGKVEDMIKQTK